jgi:hypothetical protein
MEISSFAKDELLLRNRLFMVGDFDMPFVYSQDVNVKDIALLGFNGVAGFGVVGCPVIACNAVGKTAPRSLKRNITPAPYEVRI